MASLLPHISSIALVFSAFPTFRAMQTTPRDVIVLPRVGRSKSMSLSSHYFLLELDKEAKA